MANHSDLTFITNERGQNLLKRFKVLIKDTEFFDVLVGYFYTTGFHTLYKSLEDIKKIRILIGISTNKETADLMQKSQEEKQYEKHFSHAETKKHFSHAETKKHFSHAETKKHFSNMLVNEMENSKDKKPVEEGVIKFLDWLRNGKLEIKAYPSENIHAKLYIMSFAEDDRDKGRVITGSSNFTQSGLIDNLEFNVELKNPSDYEFAQNKFNELWQNAVDVKEQYIDTIQKKTWLNNNISPYELYLKFLYEYFKDELSQTDKISSLYVPDEFKNLEYQEQAVLNAKKILNEYGGVFVSDVVGLGKTYMSAMLARQLDGRTLVLAPPILLDKTNPGSWPNIFSDFRVHADFESLGKLDQVIARGTEKYTNVFIDEAHRFRTETNITYERLAQICRGKRVVLVTATPLNNSPLDILSQIKLFQNAKKSTIPNVSNLEFFFKNLEKKTKELDKKENYTNYIQVVKQNAKQIRESVLKYLMVRRTRTEIESYFYEDLKNQSLKFPEVMDPEPLLYKFNKKENEVFNKTIEMISQGLKYARYTALTYYTKQDQLDQLEIQSHKNLGIFMKILLVKRLESSFYAFKNTIRRFISSYELFLREFNAGHVYISKDYSHKIFDFLSDENEEAIQKLLNEDKAKKYPAQDFVKSFKIDLENDLEILKQIKSLWNGITRDPKLDEFIKQIFSDSSDFPILKKNKLIVFTESKETADYLLEELNNKLSIEKNKTLIFTGSSNNSVRRTIIENFDAKVRFPKDDYRILITTEVLAEGVNLHLSNVVINYDIPWNPTRLMQRVGRINRVDTKFDKIYTFNFFPTEQSNDIIKLKEIAETKIQTFISLLGADARLLTEGEVIESHELFGRLISRKTIIGEDEGGESELKYLKIIKDIRDKEPNLFNKIKKLPKKARTVKKYQNKENQLLTYFRKGKLQKFFLTGKTKTEELDFMSSAKLFEVENNTLRKRLPADFYNKLEKNKEAFVFVTDEEHQEIETQRKGRDSSVQLLRILKVIKKDLRKWTEEQELYLKEVMKQIEEGALPKQTIKTVLKAVEKEIRKTGKPDSLKILAVLQNNIPDELLKSHIVESSAMTKGQREVVLSEYLIYE